MPSQCRLYVIPMSFLCRPSLLCRYYVALMSFVSRSYVHCYFTLSSSYALPMSMGTLPMPIAAHPYVPPMPSLCLATHSYVHCCSSLCPLLLFPIFLLCPPYVYCYSLLSLSYALCLLLLTPKSLLCRPYVYCYSLLYLSYALPMSIASLFYAFPMSSAALAYTPPMCVSLFRSPPNPTRFPKIKQRRLRLVVARRTAPPFSYKFPSFPLENPPPPATACRN